MLVDNRVPSSENCPSNRSGGVWPRNAIWSLLKPALSSRVITIFIQETVICMAGWSLNSELKLMLSNRLWFKVGALSALDGLLSHCSLMKTAERLCCCAV